MTVSLAYFNAKTHHVVLLDSPEHKYFVLNKLCLGVMGLQSLFVSFCFKSKDFLTFVHIL